MSARLVFGLIGFFLATLAVVPVFGNEPARKAEPPDVSRQAQATKLIREIYGRDVAAAKTAEQKKTLAAKLLQIAKENQTDASARFVLLRLSREVAAQAVDWQAAFAVVEEIDKSYQVDPLDMKADVLRKCAAAANTVDQHSSLADKAAELSDEAAAKDIFTVAMPLIELALGEARKAGNAVRIKRFSERKNEFEGFAVAFEPVKKAVATLETTPVDPEANLAVGKYKCLIRGDWEHGLPMLALGSDPALKSLGEEELKTVASAKDQAKLGDAWWNAAESQNAAEKKPMQVRAVYWYQKALPGLAGLPKNKAESRIRKFQEELPAYLADLPAEEVRVAELDPNVQQMLFKGKSWPHTVWAHPPNEVGASSHLAYRLDSKFRTIRGDVGIGGTSQFAASLLTFRIVGDGKTLWKSKPIRASGVSMSFHVSVTGVKKLELFVDCPGLNAYAWALWIDPLLER